MKKELTTMKDTLRRIEREADELIDFGNSKEKEKGKGMQYVIKEIEEYCKRHNINLSL
jgi:hypothetical protein